MQTAVATTETTETSLADSHGPAYDVVLDSEARPADWLAERARLITASEVPIVLGLKGSRTRLWYEKLGLLDREDFSGNEAASMGHRLESINASLFAEKTGRGVRRSQRLLRSRRYPWLGATLDYVQLDPARPKDPAPLELKSTGRKDLWPEDGEPHLRYQAQLQAQILVTGSSWGSVSAIIGSPFFHHRWRDYTHHTAFADEVLHETERFYDLLQSRTPPEPDDSEETSYALRHAALAILSGASINLPSIAGEWHEKLLHHKEQEAACKKQRRYYENLLAAAIGTADQGRLPDGSAYTFSVVNRDAYTVKPTSYRQLRWMKKP